MARSTWAVVVAAGEWSITTGMAVIAASADAAAGIGPVRLVITGSLLDIAHDWSHAGCRVLVDGDPTTDITATRAITDVWGRGTRHSRA
ncbi:hypothetical protein [Streptosporangium sp. NPDC087985]|uniref:hypothetical protein n=1 Tax=Streptosporangium sp. NPDC087985 TaxID=3366196 RepID=UPI0038194FDC